MSIFYRNKILNGKKIILLILFDVWIRNLGSQVLSVLRIINGNVVDISDTVAKEPKR